MPIEAAIACIAITCSSPYVVMRWISEARLCIIGSTSDTLPPCERIADATFCTAISCRPNAWIVAAAKLGIRIARLESCAPIFIIAPVITFSILPVLLLRTPTRPLISSRAFCTCSSASTLAFTSISI